MRHAPWIRAFAVVFGVWFAVALGEPAVLHACPMHGAAHVHHDASHGATAHHAGGDHSSSSLPGSHHSGCTCIGLCCAAAVTVVPIAPVALLVAESTVRAPAPVRRSTAAYRPSPTEHVRPPSQGPPLSTA